jgi:integrase
MIMSVRKRTWTNADGPQEAWIVDYVDQHGKRHIKTFAKKKQADAHHATVTIQVRQGTHTADSESITVEEAGKLWIATAEQNGLERSTREQYGQHLNFHILPHLGNVKLSQLSAPMVRDFEDKLRQADNPRSQAMVRKIRVSLGAIIADAQERGLVARNVVRELRSSRRRGKERRADRRQKGKLKVGVDIPTPSEVKAMLAAVNGRWRPFLLTAVFTGLRASELRGLRWSDVDFKKGELHVQQRADRYNAIGKPKSEAGERTVPIPPPVLNTLREWRLMCPKGPLNLVFPSTDGKVDWHANILNRALIPCQIAAGVAVAARNKDDQPIVGDDGKPLMKAKYTGLHALRHFYASWCINREVDGGLGLAAKIVQERLGHSSIVMTLDIYGHLFPRGDDTAALDKAAAALMA